MPTIKRYGKIQGDVLVVIADVPTDEGDWRSLDDIYPDQSPGSDQALFGPMIDVQADRVIRSWTIGPMPAEVLADDRRRRRDENMAEPLNLLSRHRNQKDFGLSTTLSEAEAKKWADYLQGLRDYPETGIWPIRPGN